jgi:photosystem II stability/assembly factor-like uncharacterized protein
MKSSLFLVLLAFLAFTGCKKDSDVSPPKPLVATLPFENDNVRVELIATTLPGWIQSLCFIDAAVGVAGTYDGKLYKTTDGGRNWMLQYTTNAPLLQIVFTSASVGYVVGGSVSCNGAGCTPPGGLILKTTDGGNTWAAVYRASGVAIPSLAVSSAGELLAVSNNTGSQILKSADAGATWLPVASWPYQLIKIAFDRDRGYCATAKGTIVKSVDNGASWSDASTFTYPYLNELAFSTGIGFCVTGYGPVYKTTNDGANWVPTAQSSFSAQVINALTPTSCLIFGSGTYSGGDFGTFSGSLRQSTDGGNSWTEIELSTVHTIYYSSFYTPKEGYALAGSTLLKVTVK